MVRRPIVREVSEAIATVMGQLTQFSDEYAQLSFRERVRRLVDVSQSQEDLNVSVVHDTIEVERSAKARLRRFFTDNVGEVLHADELAVVAGISEYARRIRELRREEGYRILTGVSDETAGVELRPDQYLLIDATPDTDAARRWHVANRIRNEKIGSKAKLLKYLIENVHRVVTTDELKYVAKAAQYARRVRELRTEDGYAVATRFTGRPDLRAGEYVLLDSERVSQPHDRRVPIEVQREVYERDQNQCRLCHWHGTDWTPEDPRLIELHHRFEHEFGGENTTDNLMLLCNRCHDDVHAGRKSV
ncbi:HNH endonuclease [Neorhodopirellula lusitana]|uniref:HNH endonuclease n=1 Tax=Neorhodopirellula lusitana TaxID=445327 RepID=UPI003850FDD9